MAAEVHAEIDGPDWRTSSRCAPENLPPGCVEVARLSDGGIAVRDSKDVDGPVLRYAPVEWNAFIAGVKDGEFDLT